MNVEDESQRRKRLKGEEAVALAEKILIEREEQSEVKPGAFVAAVFSNERGTETISVSMRDVLQIDFNQPLNHSISFCFLSMADVLG